jgi:GDP-L-fucose synthase
MKTLILGHTGMLGSALMRRLPNAIGVSTAQCNLTDLSQTQMMFNRVKPNIVYLCASKVGGIIANIRNPVDFLDINLRIETNVMKCAYNVGVSKLLFIGSSCIYPRNCQLPIKEGYLLSGFLEETNSAYAIAKIAGVELVKSYRKQFGCNWITAMCCNLYGQGDNYDANNSHVVAGLIKKIIEAKANDDSFVEIYGTGNPKREFMHIDDCADACIYLMNNYNGDIINVGTGQETSITELAKMIAEIVDYKGGFIYNTGYPDGVSRKVMDVSRLNSIGWKYQIPLRRGLEQTISLYYGRKSK